MDTDARIEIFTDGACSGNPGPGGWGAVLRYKGQEKELSGGEGRTTNNRMELMAAITALEALKRPSAVDLTNVYDCFTITVIVTLEDAGFCKKGEGGAFVRERDLRFEGDFPVNTHGGQLGAGQSGLNAGLSHVIESVRQIQGRAGARQLPKCDLAYVNGNGGMMSEQVALILEGA